MYDTIGRGMRRELEQAERKANDDDGDSGGGEPPAWFRQWYDGVKPAEWIADEWAATLEQAGYPEQPPIETTRERALNAHDVLTDEHEIAELTLWSVRETNGGELAGKNYDNLAEAAVAASGPDLGRRGVERLR